jgi:hypothetical protein
MATYNFTVRAKDETGAFSDREFNIEVRNTMVDRILAINASNAFASVNGETWSQRTGVGGIWCDNLLGRWIIATSATGYRVSDDTLNWTEGLEFRLSNDAPVYGSPEGSEEESTEGEGGEEGGEDDGDEELVLLQPAGPLYNLPFTVLTKRFIELSGKVYAVALVGGKIGIVTSTDLEKWYLIVPENFNATSNNYFGLPNTAVHVDLRTWTTLERHNGQYVVYNGATKHFIVSDDLQSFQSILPSNHASMAWSYMGANSRNYAVDCKSLNGILFIQYRTVSTNGSYPSRRYPRSHTYYTIDLNNISIPGNNLYNASYRGTDGILPFNSLYYNNGILYALNNTGKAYLDRPTQMLNNSDSVSVRDATVFDGEVLTISSGRLYIVAASQSLATKAAAGLPTSGLVSICSM